MTHAEMYKELCYTKHFITIGLRRNIHKDPLATHNTTGQDQLTNLKIHPSKTPKRFASRGIRANISDLF